jgi:acyl-CoA synthetase (AMP-forming)/AMP-acid ligase II
MDLVDDPVRSSQPHKPVVARYKVPREILIVDELPRNAVGKPDKPAMRRMFAAPDHA